MQHGRGSQVFGGFARQAFKQPLDLHLPSIISNMGIPPVVQSTGACGRDNVWVELPVVCGGSSSKPEAAYFGLSYFNTLY